MTVGDLAEYLQVSRTTVYKLMKREKDGFPAVKLGGRWLVDLEQMRNWLLQVVERREKLTVQRRRRKSVGVKGV